MDKDIITKLNEYEDIMHSLYLWFQSQEISPKDASYVCAATIGKIMRMIGKDDKDIKEALKILYQTSKAYARVI